MMARGPADKGRLDQRAIIRGMVLTVTCTGCGEVVSTHKQTEMNAQPTTTTLRMNQATVKHRADKGCTADVQLTRKVSK